MSKPAPKCKSKAQAYQAMRREWKQEIRRLSRRVGDRNTFIADTRERLNNGKIHGEKAKNKAAQDIYTQIVHKSETCYQISILQNYLNMFKAEE